MNTFSLSPLFRTAVGFDRFNDLFESAMSGNESGNSYPPYNIEKLGENDYCITMAVAGFKQSDLNISFERDTLTVSGRIEEKSDKEDVTFLHRGIANRAFERQFRLADNMEVEDAKLEDGLLRIELKHIIPEEDKPRQIPINGNGKLLEGQAE